MAQTYIKHCMIFGQRSSTMPVLIFVGIFMDTLSRIKQQIEGHDLLLYMKGTPQFPQCGFSGQVVHLLKLCKAQFAYVNILENPDIRQTLPMYANWPTFPQLYVKGELIGGCDIVTEMYEKGELQELLAKAEVVGEKMQSKEAIV